MKRTAKRCLFSLALCTLVAGILPAQDQGSGTARVSDLPAGAAPIYTGPSGAMFPGGAPAGGLYDATPVDVVFNPRVFVDNRSNQLYGYESGYSQIGAFLPYFIDQDALVFAQGGGFVGYDGRGGGGVGVGWRYFMEDLDRIVGLNVFYDFDAAHVRSYNQVGIGFESLGRYIDLRVNGYIPVGQDQNVIGTTLIGPASFRDNRIMLLSAADTETAYTGFDAEIGGPVPLLGRYGLSAYAGFYFFTTNSTNSDFTGVSARAQWQVNEDTTVGFQVTDDHSFGTNTQVQVAFTLPDGKSSEWLRQPRVRDRLVQNVFRNNRVTVKRETRNSETAAINPKDGAPYFVVHVDPNGPVNVAQGDGTAENPFNLISQFDNLAAGPKSNVDIIYVTARTDGTAANLDTGVNLLFCQRLLSTAEQHTFMSNGQTFALPGFIGGQRPILSNITPGSAVVTLDSQNEVSGFIIDGTSSATATTGNFNRGIVSGIAGSNGFNINHNTFRNFNEGVNIVSTGSATGIIQNNDLTGAGSKSILGIGVTHTSGTLDLLVSNNVVSNVLGEDTNGDGILQPSEDVNNNGVLDPGEDTNGNGLLDAAEDSNADGILQQGIGINIVSTGPTAIILADDPTSTTLPTGILNNTVSNNGLGMNLVATNGGIFSAILDTNIANNNTDAAGFGIRVLADNGLFNLVQFQNNSTNNNAGDGTVLAAANGGLLVVGDLDLTTDNSMVNNQYTGNTLNGLVINANAGTILMEDILDTVISGNGQDGLFITATAGGNVTIGDGTANNLITGNTFQQNGANGAHLLADGGTINALFGATGATLSNAFNQNTANGLLIETANGGAVTTGLFGNTANQNGASGFAFSLDSGTIDLNGIQNNTATNNGADGMSIINGNGGVFSTPFIANNLLNDNARAGLFFGGNLPGPTSFNIITTITGNNFDRTVRGTVGMLFDTNNVVTAGSVGFAPINVTRNSFVGGNANTLFGIGGEVTDGGLFMQLGSANPLDTNVFTNNREAQIGLIFNGTSINSFSINNHTFNGTTNTAFSTLFLGDGVNFQLQDEAILTGQIQNSIFQNNANDGIHIDVSGNNALQFAQLLNYTIGNATLPPQPSNTFENNGGDGVEIFRVASGRVVNAEIINNLFQDNVQNGIRITAANADLLDTYTINDNLIRRSGLNGIALEVRFDADIQADIARNVIGGSAFDDNPFLGPPPVHLPADGNGLDGIVTTEVFNAFSDSRSITGIWDLNTIINNGDDGIDLGATMANLVIGSAAGNGNLISSNASDGIQITGSGDVTIGFNTIINNGTVGTLGTAAETAGIRSLVTPIGPQSVINLVGNTVIDNRGDGIQFAVAQGFSTSSVLNLDQNQVLLNDGRGIDILNRGNNFLQVTATNNTVTNNLLEGVYIVNTASFNQQQFAGSTVALLQDANVNFGSVLEMQFASNNVIGNGLNSLLDGTGLVVRVGTGDGNLGVNNPGGFASVGAAVAVGGSPIGNSSFLAGVTMSVDNNTFGGNAGDDILFHSFVSTVNPNTGTSWNTDPANASFNTNGYQTDPLSRFDLYFRNNTFDPGALDSVGTGLGGFIARNNALVAFYNNPDGVFKSRLNNIAAPNSPGPFNNASRARNATRQAARITPFLAPGSPIGATFLYPGIGESTWRISTDSLDGINFAQGFGGNVDNVPYLDANSVFAGGDANGSFLNGIGANGELPFGWGLFP